MTITETREYLTRRYYRAEQTLNDALEDFKHAAATYDPRQLSSLTETIASRMARVDKARSEVQSLWEQLDMLKGLNV